MSTILFSLQKKRMDKLDYQTSLFLVQDQMLCHHWVLNLTQQLLFFMRHRMLPHIQKQTPVPWSFHYQHHQTTTHLKLIWSLLLPIRLDLGQHRTAACHFISHAVIYWDSLWQHPYVLSIAYKLFWYYSEGNKGFLEILYTLLYPLLGIKCPN